MQTSFARESRGGRASAFNKLIYIQTAPPSGPLLPTAPHRNGGQLKSMTKSAVISKGSHVKCYNKSQHKVINRSVGKYSPDTWKHEISKSFKINI